MLNQRSTALPLGAMVVKQRDMTCLTDIIQWHAKTEFGKRWGRLRLARRRWRPWNVAQRSS